MPCPYSELFGKPNEGVHRYRFMGIAIVDAVSTVASALLISRTIGYSFTNTLLFLFLLGIILHRIFCVRTTIDKLLFKYKEN